MSNATKANIIAAINALMGLLVAFDVASLSDVQKGAVVVVVNSLLAIFVGATYQNSPKRIAGS